MPLSPVLTHLLFQNAIQWIPEEETSHVPLSHCLSIPFCSSVNAVPINSVPGTRLARFWGTVSIAPLKETKNALNPEACKHHTIKHYTKKLQKSWQKTCGEVRRLSKLWQLGFLFKINWKETVFCGSLPLRLLKLAD